MRITIRLALTLVSAVLLILYLSTLVHAGGSALRLLLLATTITWISLWIIRRTIAAPLDRLAQWMRLIRIGESASFPYIAKPLEPVVIEAVHLAQSLAEAKAAAEEEARLRHKGEAIWTGEKLKEHVRTKLEGRPLFLVANREPYEHIRRGKAIAVRTPASGLVTGIEPILRACGGTWIAHGSGDADRATVDRDDKVRVPPDEPQYTLKRVWLEEEEEEGYYYGFSNEGLWPLCHIAHTRPVFDTDDWRQYQAVNRKFTDSLLQEMKGQREPCVLIQDYHFSLMPLLVKRARPDARVALFWHIPWPNPEAFDICPWRKEILDGMLGTDLLGFHTQIHCNNFLETVDRTLECRVDWDRFAVKRSGHATKVLPFPISIAFPPPAGTPPRPAAEPEAIFDALGVRSTFLGVGVDRIDYTKGILERFRAIERFLEKNDEYRGRFTFVEFGAPSRTLIKRYHDLLAEVELEADRVNQRFQSKQYKPIVLFKSFHTHEEIEPFYRAAHLCLVSSLHDGMNLVAKEFVASRDDERGVLILSRFTGAARELRDAIIVNPYDTEQMAEAIRAALTMPPREQGRRMAAMRRVLREQNVYLWAGRLLEELAKIPAYALNSIPSR